MIEVEVEAIRPNPRQPRQNLDDESLSELAESIKAVGVLQPVVVRPAGDTYELVVGERRWRAAMMAGLARVPAIVRDTADPELLRDALVENLHRKDLNPMEEAAAYKQLMEDFGETHESISRKVGKSRTAITNKLRLLQLPPAVQALVRTGRIGEGHARAILALPKERQESVALAAAREGWSVRQVEELGKRESRAPRRRRGEALPSEVEEELDVAEEALGVRVRVVGYREGSGRLEVAFRSLDELRLLLARLIGRQR